jgi:long-chain acyl-CoA synthetase
MQRLSEECLFDQLKASLTIDDKPLCASALLARAYRRFPRQEAVVAAHQAVTYQELYFRSILLSRYLQSRGLKAHDRVVLYYENSLEFYVAYFAIWQIGCVVVPFNIFLHDKELVHVINDAKPSAAIASQSLMPNLVRVMSLGVENTALPVWGQEVFDWQTPYDERVCEAFVPCSLEGDAMCALLYTSGTTGLPRGVMLSSQNVIINALQCFARFMYAGMSHNETFFCVLPLFHVFAQNTCLWLPVMIGARVIVVAKIDRKLILEGLEKEPTVFLGFPALYGLLCMMKTAPLQTIKLFVSGADMLPDKIRLLFAQIYGRKICAGYGLSEASPVVAVDLDNADDATQIVGEPFVGLACSIRDDEGNELPVGTVGTLWLKGGNVMLGYHNAPEATNKVLVNGWLNTGDLGMLDRFGRLAISGRVKDIIIHKGFNIYPAEIENILLTHPAVFKAAVIGYDEEMAGQVPIAYVAVKTIDAALEKNLRILCAQNLAAYKIPRQFICLDDLPMNATGKVDKKKLPRFPSM